MTRFKPQLTGLALLAGATALPALASGSASSASSEGSSASVGSLSTSIENSSDASSKGGDVAQGDYRIIEVAAAPARPGTVRVTLQALAAQGAEGRLFLYVPQQTVAGAQLAVGEQWSMRANVPTAWSLPTANRCRPSSWWCTTKARGSCARGR